MEQGRNRLKRLTKCNRNAIFCLTSLMVLPCTKVARMCAPLGAILEDMTDLSTILALHIVSDEISIAPPARSPPFPLLTILYADESSAKVFALKFKHCRFRFNTGCQLDTSSPGGEIRCLADFDGNFQKGDTKFQSCSCYFLCVYGIRKIKNANLSVGCYCQVLIVIRYFCFPASFPKNR